MILMFLEQYNRMLMRHEQEIICEKQLIFWTIVSSVIHSDQQFEYLKSTALCKAEITFIFIIVFFKICFFTSSAHGIYLFLYFADDPTTFISHLPIYQDGSCNGLQHYAALGRDQEGGKEVNLVPAEKPSDVYSSVAMRCAILTI